MSRAKRDATTIPLSDREAQCLALYTQGIGGKHIARMLHTTPRSVYGALDKCQWKLNVKSREELRVYAHFVGLDTVQQERTA